MTKIIDIEKQLLEMSYPHSNTHDKRLKIGEFLANKRALKYG
jgi:hypothetical protein